MGRRPTVYDVAKRAGVSIATVSFAFRRPEQVREETRQTVLEAARELGYIPSGAARGLASGRTGALGLYAFDFLLERPQADASGETNAGRDELTNGLIDLTRSVIPWEDAHDELLSDPRAFPLYVDEVRRGFELECKRRGRPVLVSSGADATVTETAGRVDGLAVFPGTEGAAALERVPTALPVVVFSSPHASDQHHRVTVDNHGGIRDLVTHLVVDHGIDDIAFVGALSVPDYLARFEALREVLSLQQLPVPNEVVDDTVLGDSDTFVHLKDRLRSASLPRALVCASDQIALAVIDLLTTHGLRVPQDVVVTGFDGILAGQLSRPTLTTVRQPMETMGRVAARVLIEETEHASKSPRVYQIGTHLIRRESCGCSA